MAKNKWFIPSLAILGVLFFALSWFMSNRLDTDSPGLKPLGRVSYNSGEVSIFHKNMTEKEDLKKSLPLYYLDSIETGPDGDASLEFDGGLRMRMLDNVLLTVDQDQDKAVLILKRGDLQIENHSNDSNVLFSKNGQRLSLNEYENLLRREAVQSGFPENAPPPGESPAEETTDNLSSDYIQNTLKRQVPAFDKCYKQLLQRTPGIVGQVVMTFTIERTGRITDAEPSTSTIADADFKRCLSEAIRRVEFKSFTGDPITSTFPLNFE